MATAELIVERADAGAQAWRLPAQIPELDGLRGLAVLLVMICHSAIWLPQSLLRSVLVEGKIGVDLFFVLSGFLITGILLETQADRHALRNFYVRRGLRIWPLYFVFLLAAFMALRRMVPATIEPWVYVLVAQNFFYVANTGPLLDPLWSLAVEEQFYLVWPWIALRVRRETVLKICCAVLVVSPMLRFAMRAAGASEEFVYANTLCRLDGIALGGMIAAWVRGHEFSLERLRKFSGLTMLGGISGAGLTFLIAGQMPFSAEIRYSFVAIACGGLLAAALVAQGTESRLARGLRSWGITGLGRISFAVYLFNLPIYTFMHGARVALCFSSVPVFTAGLLRLLIGNMLLLVLAVCSWKFLESPVLRMKSRLAPRTGPAELRKV